MDDYRNTTSSDELTREERMQRREERRKRRRARLDLHLSATSVLVVFVFVLVVGALLLFLPRPKTSTIEKRDLATFPKFTISNLLSGSFTKGIMTYYDDTIPFRDPFKNMNNSMKNWFGLRSGGGVEIIGTVNKVESEEAANDGASPSAASSSTDPASDPDLLSSSTDSAAASAQDTAAGQNKPKADDAEDYTGAGFLILHQEGHWRALSFFSGGSCQSYISFLNDLRSQLDDSVRVYSMPVPLATGYYLPEEYADYSADQKATFQKVFHALNDGITPVSAYDALAGHTDEEIFFRTDHHWTMLGAYYACEEFASLAGVPYSPLDSYAEIRRDGYVGSIYGFTSSANILKDPEPFTFYIPSVSYEAAYYDKEYRYQYADDLFAVTDLSNSYMVFHAGDTYMMHTKTAVKNGRKVLILKDSYGDPMDALLTGSFEEIYSADLRFCDVNFVDFIQQMGITDVLIALNATNMAEPSGDLSALLTQNKGAGIPDDGPELTVADGPGSPYYQAAASGEDPLLVEG